MLNFIVVCVIRCAFVWIALMVARQIGTMEAAVIAGLIAGMINITASFE